MHVYITNGWFRKLFDWSWSIVQHATFFFWPSFILSRNKLSNFSIWHIYQLLTLYLINDLFRCIYINVKIRYGIVAVIFHAGLFMNVFDINSRYLSIKWRMLTSNKNYLRTWHFELAVLSWTMPVFLNTVPWQYKTMLTIYINSYQCRKNKGDRRQSTDRGVL